MTGSTNGANQSRSVLLGVFILFQLAFLLVENFGRFFQDSQAEMPAHAQAVVRQFAPEWPEKRGHVWNLLEGVTQVTHRWSQLTWQLQSWSLFAPSVGTECVFPALLLTDEEPPETPIEPGGGPDRFTVRGKVVLSDNEPANLANYVRWGNFRLRRFENNLVIYLRPKEDEQPHEVAERFRERIKEAVADNSDMLRGYLQFRLEQLHEPPSRQVILLMRRFSLTGPAQGVEFVEGPFTIPMARWLPQAGAESRLEYFNPVTQQFEATK